MYRNQVKVDYLMSLESSDGLLEELGLQGLVGGAYSPPEAVLQKIDSITSDAVTNVSSLPSLPPAQKLVMIRTYS